MGHSAKVAGVSEQKQQTYILHTVAIAIAIIVAMVLFLRHQWGGH